MSVIRPQFMALDSAQLGNWARDRSSNCKRAQALSFENWLSRTSTIVLLCWHHLEELFSSESNNTVDEIISFLSGLDSIAWIRPRKSSEIIGSIQDILSAEVEAALLSKNQDAISVRNDVAREILLFGRPAFFDEIAEIKRLVPLFREYQKSQRKTVAISRAKFVDIPNMTVRELFRQKVRKPASAAQEFKGMRDKLAQSIAVHGDSRIANPASVAETFLLTAFNEIGPDYPASAEDLLGRICRFLGIEVSSLNPDTNLRDLIEEAECRKRVRIVTGDAEARSVTLDRLPSWIVQKMLTVHYPKLRRHEGGELNDIYLATLALYADITFVDRRTMEGINKARDKDPRLRQMLRRVEKSTNYSAIPMRLQN